MHYRFDDLLGFVEDSIEKGGPRRDPVGDDGDTMVSPKF